MKSAYVFCVWCVCVWCVFCVWCVCVWCVFCVYVCVCVWRGDLSQCLEYSTDFNEIWYERYVI